MQGKNTLLEGLYFIFMLNSYVIMVPLVVTILMNKFIILVMDESYYLRSKFT